MIGDRPGTSSDAPSGTVTVLRVAGRRSASRAAATDAVAALTTRAPTPTTTAVAAAMPDSRKKPRRSTPAAVALPSAAAEDQRRRRRLRMTRRATPTTVPSTGGSHASAVAPARVTIAAVARAPPTPSRIAPTGRKRYSSTPATAAATAAPRPTPASRAILSDSPKTVIASSFSGRGTMSTMNDPTASTGLADRATSTANSSATASSAAADTSPAREAQNQPRGRRTVVGSSVRAAVSVVMASLFLVDDARSTAM